MNEDAILSDKALKEQNKAAQGYKHSGSKGQTAQMHAKVYSPFKDYFDGLAFSISAVNLTGPFDILPHHHNFISLLIPCDILIRTPLDDVNGPIKIRISGGLLHVKADNVIVFLDV